MTEKNQPPTPPTQATQAPARSDGHPDTFLQGVILGVLLGCVLVLWFSPQTGKDLFEAIKKRLPIAASNPTDRRKQ